MRGRCRRTRRPLGLPDGTDELRNHRSRFPNAWQTQTHSRRDGGAQRGLKLDGGSIAECGMQALVVKSALVRLGIRGFNPKLRKAPERLATLRTPEGCPIPPNTLAELTREMAHLRFINAQIKQIEDERLQQLKCAPQQGSNAKVLQLEQVNGIGVETADMLTHEVLSRDLRDQRAVARYSGLTGSPDESGSRRREKGLSKMGNARVRRGMIQLAWRFLFHQRDSALAQWYQASVAAGKKRKTMIVALARKLLIALWRFLTTGEVPEGVVLRPTP